jgi:hypothetical protein
MGLRNGTLGYKSGPAADGYENKTGQKSTLCIAVADIAESGGLEIRQIVFRPDTNPQARRSG